MKKFSKLELVRLVGGLEAYPAVMMPVAGGGLEVVFTNFADLKAYGIKREMARKAAREVLTAEILNYAESGLTPPNPSDPERLIADEDEPPGTELIMVEADKGILMRRLGLEKKEKGAALRSLGLYGR